MENAIKQLDEMKIKYHSIQPIRDKNGISLYRVICDDKTYVLKYFASEADRREIGNYQILQSLGIRTMEMVFHSEKSVLLEDIEGIDTYRLGVEADLNDIDVAAGVVRWYRQLHQSGEAFVRVHGDDLYDENDIISLENIEIIKTKTSTQSNPVWAEIEENLDVILSIVKAAKRTLTYNVFIIQTW